jgi:hypothetical protein
MDITNLHLKSKCKIYFGDKEEEQVQQNYRNLEEKLRRAGWNALSFGIIDIKI